MLRSTGSRLVGFSGCGTRAQYLWLVVSRAQASVVVVHGLLLCGMWDLPGPGLKPVSPALAGGFLTTAPPGKPRLFFKLIN